VAGPGLARVREADGLTARLPVTRAGELDLFREAVGRAGEAAGAGDGPEETGAGPIPRGPCIILITPP
jgi:hypothetical protein